MDRIFQNDDILIFTHGINSYSNAYVTVGNLSDEYASVRDNDPSKFVNAGNWLENAGTRFEIGSKSDGKNFKSAISRAYTGLRIVNRDSPADRKSTRLNSSHPLSSRMPSSA